MTDTVLCINAGSSSIKFQLFESGENGALSLRTKGSLDGIAVKPRLQAENADGRSLVDQAFEPTDVPDTGDAVPLLLGWLRDHLAGVSPAVIGHRVVFGGTRYTSPVVIDDQVLTHLRSLVPFMPMHLPPALIPIEAIREKLPDLRQVAVFDTGFHCGRDELSERFAIPDELHREGLRRYGYHGISYEYIAGQLPDIAPDIADGKVVVAHLGSGCSMCALVAGRSVETTMGFSALDGLPMGTRPGRLDPGLLLYLAREKGMSTGDIERLLYEECGLKALSGISNDVRILTGSDDPRSAMALDYFSLACARSVAELATVMGGIDAIVFTAGVGENVASVRANIVRRLAWLGMVLDESANTRHQQRITTDCSNVAGYVIPTNEELMIARHAEALVRLRRERL